MKNGRKAKKKLKEKYKILLLTRIFVKLHALLLNMLFANYKEELIFFGIDIWQEIIRIDFTYQNKKTHKIRKFLRARYFRCHVALTK